MPKSQRSSMSRTCYCCWSIVGQLRTLLGITLTTESKMMEQALLPGMLASRQVGNPVGTVQWQSIVLTQEWYTSLLPASECTEDPTPPNKTTRGQKGNLVRSPGSKEPMISVTTDCTRAAHVCQATRKVQAHHHSQVACTSMLKSQEQHLKPCLIESVIKDT